jgi:hypothetical protein
MKPTLGLRRYFPHFFFPWDNRISIRNLDNERDLKTQSHLLRPAQTLDVSNLKFWRFRQLLLHKGCSMYGRKELLKKENKKITVQKINKRK